MRDRQVAQLLIGGGIASANCARWLREAGAEEEILLVGRELDPPYDRPPCSKGYLGGKEERASTYFRPPEWWAEQDVELLTRTSVTKLDPAERLATLSNGQRVAYKTALLATGANVRRLPVEGAELEGIHYLRTLGNADSIRDGLAEAEHVVLIGGSYIGSEVAASLTALGKRCAIVMQERLPLQLGFGEQAARFFGDVLERHGVVLHGEDSLARFEGAQGRVTKVITERGRELPADLVVIGAGAVPDVTLAKAAGLELGASGGVKASARLETSAPGVYAAGDICEYDSPMHGGSLRIEHWDVAFTHGKTAALNMLGTGVAHEVVPYFFSDLADWASLAYVGPARTWEREVVRGSLEQGAFSIWYLSEGRVAAALAVGRDEDLVHARRMVAERAVLGDDGEGLADLDTDLASVG